MKPVTYTQNPRTAGRVIDGTAFVVTPHDNKLHTLNGTATFVWTLAEADVTLDQIALALTSRFRVELPRARSDAAEFVASLCTRGILTERNPA